MKNIGVVLPYEKDRRRLRGFLKKFSYKTIYIEEYGFNFIVADDSQNCSKIFNKNKVEHIVLLTDCEIESCDFKVISGDFTFKKLLPEYVRKTIKKTGDSCSVTVVDKKLSADCILITEKLCDFCHSLSICTENFEGAEKLCDDLFDKYGIAVNIIGKNDLINDDVVTVLEDCGNTFGENCLIIDKKCKKMSPNIISDFYIPFRIKPPFNMSNLVFQECIDIINC